MLPASNSASDAESRALPDHALCGPGKREMIWIHGSLASPRPELAWKPLRWKRGDGAVTAERDAEGADDELDEDDRKAAAGMT